MAVKESDKLVAGHAFDVRVTGVAVAVAGPCSQNGQVLETCTAKACNKSVLVVTSTPLSFRESRRQRQRSIRCNRRDEWLSILPMH